MARTKQTARESSASSASRPKSQNKQTAFRFSDSNALPTKSVPMKKLPTRSRLPPGTPWLPGTNERFNHVPQTSRGVSPTRTIPKKRTKSPDLEPTRILAPKGKSTSQRVRFESPIKRSSSPERTRSGESRQASRTSLGSARVVRKSSYKNNCVTVENVPKRCILTTGGRKYIYIDNKRVFLKEVTAM